MSKFLVFFLLLLVTYLYSDPSWEIYIVESEGDVGRAVSMEFDSECHPCISYWDATNSDLKYAHYNGIGWEFQIVDSSGNVGRFSSLELDSNDYPCISYRADGPDYTLKYAHYNGTGWEIETVDPGGGHDCSLELNSSGHPCIAYWEWPDNYLKYAVYNGSGWEIQVVDSEGTSDGESVSLELDANDYPHIAYRSIIWGGSQDAILRYAKYNGTGWEIETVDSSDIDARDVSLKIDSNGYAHISYFDNYYYDLKYAKYNGSGWEVQFIYSGPGDKGRWTSLILDENDYPHIAFLDNSAGKFMLGIYNGEGWVFETVESGVGYASYPYDDEYLVWDGNFHYLAYYENVNDDLHYAEGHPEPSSFSIFLLFLFILYFIEKILKVFVKV